LGGGEEKRERLTRPNRGEEGGGDQKAEGLKKLVALAERKGRNKRKLQKR